MGSQSNPETKFDDVELETKEWVDFDEKVLCSMFFVITNAIT